MPGWYPLPDDEKFDFKAIHDAYDRGDLEALRAALHQDDFPNNHCPLGFGEPLIQAIYSSPISFIRQLLEIGADPKIPVDDGFPPLIAALTSDRPERNEIVKLLLEFGADVHQRGLNGWFPLHVAAHNDDPEAIGMLLQHGADPEARTNVDDYETALEESERGGKTRSVEALRKARQKK
jgi:ankyrin repeat protein